MKRYLLPAIVLAFAANLAVALAAPAGSKVTIAASPNPVVFGRSVALSGHLTGKNKAGKTIQVQADAFPYDNSFKNVASATTANNGAWATTDKPAVNTRYRARQGSTISGVVTELVRIRVSLRLSDRTPAAGQRVRFSGRAAPANNGALVYIQRRTATGRWSTVSRAVLGSATGNLSTYSKRIKIRASGVFRARVLHTNQNATGTSRAKHATVH
jgi:hypothetical protein